MTDMYFVYEAKSAYELIRKCQELTFVTMSGEWSFRGQANSEWTLKPSLLRQMAAGFDPEEFENNLLKDLRWVLRQRTTLPPHIIEDESCLL
jgi:hypothetical protein